MGTHKQVIGGMAAVVWLLQLYTNVMLLGPHAVHSHARGHALDIDDQPSS
jgi:hypothetical protein